MIDITQKLGFLGDGVAGTATRNTSSDTSTNFDYKIPDNKLYLTGAEIIYKDALWGDYVKFQIIDIDNILGLGANTVLNEYVSKWYIAPTKERKEVITPYGGNILKDLYIRVIYTAVSDTLGIDAKVALNFYLHKVL